MTTGITPDELNRRLATTDDVFVLDIRDESEYEEWHIPGSENVPVYDELADDPEAADEALSTAPRDKEVVTVCAAGIVSRRATERLRARGYDAKTLVDGMRGWSRVHRRAPIDVDIDGTLVQVARPGTGCLSHVLVSGGEAAVFDPSQYPSEYEAVLADHDADLIGVFDTHAHADHVSSGERLAARHDVPYFLHPEDAVDVRAAPLHDDQSVLVGDVELDVLHTPGHSPGSVTFAVEDAALLTGDTLFHRSVGRVELGVEAGIDESDVEANAHALYESLQRLRTRAGDPFVLPAHDPGSPEPPVAARFSDVVARNPDLDRSHAEFVETLAADVPDQPPNFQRIKRVNAGIENVPDDERSSLELGPNRCAAE